LLGAGGSPGATYALEAGEKLGACVDVAKVEIYTKFTCGYCHRAKALLKQKGADLEEISVDLGGPKKQEMIQRANGRMTVPQIFIDGKHVGGCDDLFELEDSGKLDELLAA
jgi:glutaredoxin 3